MDILSQMKEKKMSVPLACHYFFQVWTNILNKIDSKYIRNKNIKNNYFNGVSPVYKIQLVAKKKVQPIKCK